MFLAFCATVNATEWIEPGAKQKGMGGCSLFANDIFSVFNNPAASAMLKKTEVGFWGENRFGIKGLGGQSFALGTPVKNGFLGAGFRNFGNANYSDQHYLLSYGHGFADRVYFGLQLNVLRVNFSTFTNVAISGGFSVVGKVTNNLLVSAYIYNPMRSKILDFYDERIPTVMKLGANYKVSEKVNTFLEFVKDLDRKESIRIGIEYTPAESFKIRGGISNATGLSSLGFSYLLKSMEIDMAMAYHQTLGFTPSMSLRAYFNKSK